MRPIWLLVLAACAEPAAPAPAPAPPPAQPRAIAPLGPPRLPGPPRPTEPVSAPIALARGGHGLAIVSVAVSEDGTAALTIDSGHHARLWPALDGTREPLVLPVQTPLATAIERTGGELVAAILDTAGGITVLRVDAEDRLVGRAVATAEASYGDVIAATDGFLAVRADQTIEQLDPRGRSRGVLAPEPGQRIVGLVQRRGRALALVADREGTRGRWLELGAGAPAWGELTPALDIDPTTAVLSPDHVHLAAIQRKPRRTAIIDLASGTAKPLRGAPIPLGFVADDRVAVARADFDISLIQWWDTAGTLRDTFGQNFELDFVSVRPVATGDGRVVSFFEQELVLVAPRGGLRYLGYGTTSASRLRESPFGMVASLGGATSLLDPSLRAARAVPTPAGATDTILIDGRHTVNLVGAVDNTVDDDWIDPALVKRIQRGRWIELRDLEAKKVQRLALRVHEARLHYERSTQLLGAAGDGKLTFVRYRDGAFEAPITVRIDGAVRELALLDPAHASGSIAMIAQATARGTVVRRIGPDFALGDPVTVPGALEAIDRAGHVYVREGRDSVAIYGSEGLLGRLDDVRSATLRPSPDGSRVAVFGRARVSLASTDGTARWAIGFPTIGDLQWSPTGELIAAAGGLARLDPDTGAVIGAQCGWRFALRTDPSGGSRKLSICDR